MGLGELAAVLDGLVDSGRLVGWVAGVAECGTVRLGSGGRQRIDGPAMTEHTQFAIASCTKPIGGVLALRLVEAEILRLDEPVDRWLPELAEPRVLERPDGPLDQTVPARRAITLRDLLTMTAGFGFVADGPLARAMAEQQLAPGPFPPPIGPDEFMRRLGSLPLADQPGRTWRYHTSSDVLGVLLARAAGRPLRDLVAEQVTGPLQMSRTGFVGDATQLATAYGAGPDGAPTPYRVPAGCFTAPPAFESLAAGLVSTVADYLAFLSALAHESVSGLGAASSALLRTDQLTDGQRAGAAGFLADGSGWGHHLEVRADGLVGWAGGLGTIGYADPRRGRAAALFTQQSVQTPGTAAAFDAFWSLLD